MYLYAIGLPRIAINNREQLVAFTGCICYKWNDLDNVFLLTIISAVFIDLVYHLHLNCIHTHTPLTMEQDLNCINGIIFACSTCSWHWLSYTLSVNHIMSQFLAGSWWSIYFTFIDSICNFLAVWHSFLASSPIVGLISKHKLTFTPIILNWLTGILLHSNCLLVLLLVDSRVVDYLFWDRTKSYQ